MSQRANQGDKQHDEPRSREEAKPFDWKELTPDQQKAVVRAHEFVIAAANARATDTARQPDPLREQDERADFDAVLPRIDRERPNRVLLIDGGRGSGKTSVLITLLHAWSEHVRGKDWPLVRADESKNTSEGRENGLEPPEKPPLCKVLPLPILDLQPLPESTHLILQLAGSFLPIIERSEARRIGGSQSRTKSRAWHLDENELPSRKAWREFLRAAALGWDGNLSGRRAELDPEAFVLELEQAERFRTDVVPTWTPLVNAVLSDLVDTGGLLARQPQPLLVIPIDDADMNPHRSIELLDLMRKLWHPRVVFLLTGDSDLFLLTAKEYFLGTLRRPLRGLTVSASETAAMGDLDEALRLAGALYDRVVPPGNRCELPELTPGRRLEFLKEPLEKIETRRIKLGTFEGKTLYALLDQDTEIRKLLPPRLRALVDLKQTLSELAASGSGPELTGRVVVQLLKSELMRSRLSRRQIVAIEDSIDVADDGRINIHESPWLLKARLPTAASGIIGALQVTVAGSPRFGASYQLEPGPSGKRRSRELDETIAGALVLLKLLAREDRSGVAWRGETFSVTHLWHEERIFTIGWQVPPFQRFVSRMAFAYLWAQQVRLIGSEIQQPEVDALAYFFLRTGVELLKREQLDPKLSLADGFVFEVHDRRAPPEWESLGDELAGLAQAGPALHWATRLAPLVVTPEAGVGAQARKAFRQSLPPWIRDEAEPARRARLQERTAIVDERRLDDLLARSSFGSFAVREGGPPLHRGPGRRSKAAG